ncbi:MAG: SCO family protein [Acidobacteria bacterium]|nr:SCO family protein [Acidobacteriota bacterium]MBV9477886.1 SCO family protein [Acidobacteriota bacterium]
MFVLLAVSCARRSDLPRLFPVPDAKFVDDTGKPLALASLKGNVVVYDFIFTSCTGVCPIMSNNMKQVVAKVAKDAPVRFVSISVDPQRDTPKLLSDYALRFRNDARWTFLTGDRTEIVRAAVQGFKLAAGDPTPGGEALLHSSKFAVADKEGMIRAYFDASNGEAIDQVANAVAELAEE